MDGWGVLNCKMVTGKHYQGALKGCEVEVHAAWWPRGSWNLQQGALNGDWRYSGVYLPKDTTLM
jgi:hypothetical protein